MQKLKEWITRIVSEMVSLRKTERRVLPRGLGRVPNLTRVFHLQVCSRGSQERMFFLFSDILIYAKISGSVEKEQR